MSRINIGTTATGASVSLDLDSLLRTRLLIQASSGGGKSWLIRRLAEQMFGKVQVIILDIEGEFATLRERFGYVLVGKDGETPADTRSAAMVAHKLLELNACAVCDLYEMKPEERHRWAALFLNALIDAPKRLWHPAVIIVDEAHTLAPEKGAGESEAASAVISLATRGRKRGFALVPATQRLGKLRKDVAAECGNVLVGRTTLDVDQARAAMALGIGGTKGERQPFLNELRLLRDGAFFALGPSLCDLRTRLQVGGVSTTHYAPGSSKHAAAAPPAPESVKRLLPQLADLPQQAEQKAKTEADLRAEIVALKRQLATAEKATPAPAEPVKVSVLEGEELKRAEALANQLDTGLKAYEAAFRQFGEVFGRLIAEDFSVAVSKSENLIESAQNEVRTLKAAIVKATAQPASAARTAPPSRPSTPPASSPRRSAAPRPSHNGTGPTVPAGKFRAMMVALAQASRPLSDGQVAARAGMSLSGTFDKYLGQQRTNGWITGPRTALDITDDGITALGEWDPLPTGKGLQDYWLAYVSGGKQREMLRVIIEAWPQGLSDETVAERADMALSGTFDKYLGQLRTLLLVEGPRSALRASDELFDS